uniref:Uncharacterized protein n=1 Tax=Parascaris univalens TaxID=6257 RepID=A0A915BFZ8_PARUN
MASLCALSVLSMERFIFYRHRYVLLPLIMLLRFTSAVTCPFEAIAGTKSSSSTKRKVCPDFKDDITEKFCCPSHVVPGSYYCCSEEHLSVMEAEEAAELRRQFIKNYLAVIVIGVIGAVILIVVLTMCLCKNLSFCPLNANKSACPTMQATQRYRPVDTLPTKPIVYEAPPPYECSFTEDPQRRNDWRCLLENEVNDTRQEGASFR